MNSEKILKHSGIRTTYPNAMSEPLCQNAVTIFISFIIKNSCAGHGQGMRRDQTQRGDYPQHKQTIRRKTKASILFQKIEIPSMCIRPKSPWLINHDVVLQITIKS